MDNSHFASVPAINIPHSVFDRSFSHKTTGYGGDLIPIFRDEVVPGDSFSLDTQIFVRMNNLLHPFLDNLYATVQFWYVPYRLVWEHWGQFCGEQTRPGESTDYLIPQIKVNKSDLEVHKLANYLLGIGSNQLPSGEEPVTALPFRAYNLIWNEDYRDANLQDPVDLQYGDSGDTIAQYQILKRGKRHDYFTSCLPWPQRGPAVQLPLGGSAPVVGDGHPIGYTIYDDTDHPYFGYVNEYFNYNSTGVDTILRPLVGIGMEGEIPTPVKGNAYSLRNDTNYANISEGQISSYALRSISTTPGQSGMVADLSHAISVTVNQARELFAVQRLYERDARAGSRYKEIMLAHYGVNIPDSTLQRPEYLGGFCERVNIMSVPQTSAATSASPQANLAAYGVGGGSAHIQKTFLEHGVVLGLLSFRADLSYQQGLERMWSRRTRFDFYWPVFAYLGEQAVLNKEIYVTGDPERDDGVFGYQERYAEYRYKPSMISGYLNSQAENTMDVWHLAQNFSNMPVLNSEFIQDNPPLGRVMAMPEQPPFLIDCHYHFKCSRPMPVYSVPGLIDHF